MEQLDSSVNEDDTEQLDSSANGDDSDWDGEDPEEGIIYVEQLPPSASVLCLFDMQRLFGFGRYVLMNLSQDAF